MDRRHETTESMPDSAFDNAISSVSGLQAPLANDLAFLPSHSAISYNNPTGSQSWNPYLGSVSVDDIITTQNFDPSYSLAWSADSTHAFATGTTLGHFSWSPVGLQDYPQRTEAPEEREDHDRLDQLRDHADAIRGASGYIPRRTDDGQTPLYTYGHHQLLTGQQYMHQDPVPYTVSPDALTIQSPSEPSRTLLLLDKDGTQSGQQTQPSQQSQQQTSTAPSKNRGPKSKAGTKRAVGDDDAQQVVQSDKKRRGRGRGRKSRQVLNEPAADEWTPPTPPPSLQASGSSESSASMASSFSAGLYKRASVLSISGMDVPGTVPPFSFLPAVPPFPSSHETIQSFHLGQPSLVYENAHVDCPGGSTVSRRSSLASRQPQLAIETSSTDDAGHASIVFSPTQLTTPSLNPPDTLHTSSRTTVSSTSLPTPISSTHPPASGASSLISTVARNSIPRPRNNTRQSTRLPAAAPSHSRPFTPTTTTASTITKSRRYSSATPRGIGRAAVASPPRARARRVSTSTSDQKARNRAAANKCRLKTKAAMSQLEAEERAAAELNAGLAAQAARLADEAYELRSALLRHVGCDCKLIHQYLANRARVLAADVGRQAAGGEDERSEKMGRGGEWRRKEVFGSSEDEGFEDSESEG